MAKKPSKIIPDLGKVDTNVSNRLSQSFRASFGVKESLETVSKVLHEVSGEIGGENAAKLDQVAQSLANMMVEIAEMQGNVADLEESGQRQKGQIDAALGHLVEDIDQIGGAIASGVDALTILRNREVLAADDADSLQFIIEFMSGPATMRAVSKLNDEAFGKLEAAYSTAKAAREE